jgi:uncharacterized membrane protein YdbT with pleckstrin-like domain
MVQRRRLSPWTAVVGTARELSALVVAGVTGLVVGGLSAGLYFTVAGVVLGLAHSGASWATFTYAVYDDRIELRRQFIGRSAKIIPLDRIRGVDITTRLRHRLLGVAVVHIDAAAGGHDQDAVLDAVPRAEAERLRLLLLAGAPAAAEGPGEVVYARAAPRWYLYAPLSGAYLLTPFALIGSLIGTLYNVGDDLGLITRRRVEGLTRDLAELPQWLVMTIVIVLVVAMPIASVVAFALVNWDFTLKGGGRPGEIVAERGLFTRRSVSLERGRIRGVELRDNPVERLAGVVRLDALVTGLGRAEHRGRLLPAAPTGLAYAVAARILGSTAPGPLRGHPATARARRVVRAMAPFFAAAGFAWLAGRASLAYVCLALSVLGVPLGLDRYRQLGHATGAGRLSVRSGSLRRHQAVVEHEAVVGWRLTQTLFQRRLGLATLTVTVGAGQGGYPAIDIAEPDAVAFAAEITPAWITPFIER